MNGFLSLMEYSKDKLISILDRADELEVLWRENRMPQSLKNKKIALWFYGQGFRNRVAFELGAKSMGATVSFIPGELGVHEPLEDIGPYLENWFDMLIIRSKRHEDLMQLAGSVQIPVINARTDKSHPCEIMGDLQFIRKYRGSIDNLNMVFVGEVTNLCASWFEAAVKFPIKVTQIAPSKYLADNALVENLNKNAEGKILLSDNMDAIDGSVDLIYTDCWPKSGDNMAADDIKNLFLPYQITDRHLKRIEQSKGAMFLPCPPVTRGEEVSGKAMNSKISFNFKAKNYLLHAQNAIMETML